MYTTVYYQLIELFLIVLVGYILRKTRIVSAQMQDDVANLVLWFVLPCSVIASGEMALTQEAMDGIWITCIIAVLYYISGIIILEHTVKKSNIKQNRKSVFCCLVLFANTAFLGIPIAQTLLGTKGVFYASFFNIIWSVFFFTYGISSLQQKRKSDIKTLLTRDPSFIVMITMLVVFLGQLHLPQFVSNFLNRIGNMCTPLSMLVIGCMLTEVKWKELIKDRTLYVVSLLRLVIIPVVILFVSWILLSRFAIDKAVLFVIIIMTAMPSGSLVAIYARKLNADAQYASSAIMHSMLFFNITIPFIIAAAKWLLS